MMDNAPPTQIASFGTAQEKPTRKEVGNKEGGNDTFARFCEVSRYGNTILVAAVEKTTGEGQAVLHLRQCSSMLGVDDKTLVDVTSKELLRDVDYAVRLGAPTYTLDGLLKLAGALGRPCIARDISRCLILHSKWVAQKLRSSEDAVRREVRKSQALQERLSGKYSPGERVYVMKNSVYGPDDLYKVGRTKDLHKRLSTYNTGNPHGDVTVVFEKRCCDSKLVESIVHHVLDAFRYEDNREYFKCDIHLIKDAIEHAVQATDGYRRGLQHTTPATDDFAAIERAVPKTDADRGGKSARTRFAAFVPGPPCEGGRSRALPVGAKTSSEPRLLTLDALGERVRSMYFSGQPARFTG